MKNYSKPVSVIAKIVEVGFWIGAACMVLLLIWSFFDTSMMQGLLDTGSMNLSILGLAVEPGSLDLTVLRVMMCYGGLSMSLAAMIARNISLISKSLSKDDAFCEENTPFSRDNVRMVREIGIFSISISLLALVFSWIIRLIAGANAEVSAETGGLFLGLVVLYLSTIFRYGVSLQKDVEGLV